MIFTLTDTVPSSQSSWLYHLFTLSPNPITPIFVSLHRAFAEPDFPSVLVIVSHGLLVRLFAMRWYHWSVEYFESLENLYQCEFVIMEKAQETNKYKLLTEFRRWREISEPNEVTKVYENCFMEDCEATSDGDTEKHT